LMIRDWLLRFTGRVWVDAFTCWRHHSFAAA
jgi:hypothetical protein